MFDLVLESLEVPVPDIEFLARPPVLHIRSSIEPCRDLIHSGSWIVRAAAKLHYHVQLVFLPASTTVAPVCLDGFLNEDVEEFIESILPISGDDELPSPFAELAIVFFLAKSFLHLFISLDRTPASPGAGSIGDPVNAGVMASCPPIRCAVTRYDELPHRVTHFYGSPKNEQGIRQPSEGRIIEQGELKQEI